MSQSSFGKKFVVTTWGESHGKAIGAVLDGCPAGLSLCEEDIQVFLDRRKPGQSRYTTARKEGDLVEILSGVFEGKTTGTPISLLIRMKKVVKFGGSSLANAEQFQKVGDIIRSDESRRYVVPSAPGKRFDEDIKVTDMLYGCYDAASKGEDITEKINAIKARYYEIIKGLGLSLSLEEEFKKIE